VKLRTKRTGTRLFALAALISGFAPVVASSASAATNQVAGVQSPPGAFGPACTDPSASFTMTGSLVGCWYEDGGTVTKDQFTASGIELFHFSGTEHFNGCLDVDGDGSCGAGDPSGTLEFVFTFTAQFDAATGAEIRGRCHHPIVGSSGDFAGATGVINFHDDVSNGTSPYMGHVSF
jgi:hypothetical protein